MKRFFAAIATAAAGCLISGAAPAEDRSGSFDWVWQTVHENFYDPKFNGIDWATMKTKYRDRAFMNDWLAKKTARTLTDGKALYCGIGIFTSIVNGQPFVSGVQEGLPAHKAGLQLGDRLVYVDGAPFHAIHSFAHKAGSPVTMIVERTPGVTKTVTVIPTLLDGNTLFVDAMQASAQIVERGGSKIGYVHAWSYAGRKYQDTLEQELLFGRFKQADALVLDIRDGFGGASPFYLNVFTQRCLTWTARSRSGAAETYPSCWAKPVVLLTDNRSTSAVPSSLRARPRPAKGTRDRRSGAAGQEGWMKTG